MTDERRSDVGQKIFIGLILAVCGLLGGMFVNDAFDEARLGKEIALVNKVKIVENTGEIKALRESMDATVKAILLDLQEIKTLLRRTAPYERRDV